VGLRAIPIRAPRCLYVAKPAVFGLDRNLRCSWSTITSNWKLDADPFLNPFGNSIVIAIGAAAPLKTQSIGPPVTFGRW